MNEKQKKDKAMEKASKAAWENLTPDEKKKQLYEQQKALLDNFLAHGAITKAQHDKSLHDLTVKMGYGEN